MLVDNVHLANTFEQAVREARPGHDELRQLIWPNTVRKSPALANRPPFSLEESMEAGSHLIGTPAMVRDYLLALHAEIGFEYLTIFPHLPGMTQRDTIKQMEWFQAEIMPALSARANAPEPAVSRGEARC